MKIAIIEVKLILGVLKGTNSKGLLEQLLANSRLMRIQSIQIDFELSQCAFWISQV